MPFKGGGVALCAQNYSLWGKEEEGEKGGAGREEEGERKEELQ